MADVDCNKDLRAYHNEKVILGKSSQDSMRTHRDAGRTRLKNGLTRLEKPQPEKIESQGSYSMKTMVQDDDYEYDIDDGVYFQPDDLTGFFGFRLSPSEARQRVCDALSDDDRFTSPAKVHRNCVRQTYSKGYHIDYPVYRIQTEKDENDEDKEYFELASVDEWTRSDARAVTSWFNGKVTTLNSGDVEDGSQLRRVVRYTKKFARSKKDWKEKTTSGITITKLVVDHFASSEGRDDLAIRNTWKNIKKTLDKSTEIKHPVVATNLAEKDDAAVTFFRERLSTALETLEILDESDCTREKACDAWDSVFNTDYFSKRAAADESATKSLLKPASLAVASLTFPDTPVTPNKSSGFA
jgi:hypothetical protein